MSVPDIAMSDNRFAGLDSCVLPKKGQQTEYKNSDGKNYCYPGCKGYIKGLMAEMMPWAHTIKA